MKKSSKRISESLDSALSGLGDPYTPKKGSPKFESVPSCIYFYYLGPQNVAGKRPVKHYFYTHGGDQIPEDVLTGKIRDLALNARKPNGNRPPQFGEDWKFVVWNHKSYIVVFVDDKDVNFTSRGLEFIWTDETTFNHSFFDARSDTIALPYNGGSEKFPYLYCINYMKGDDQGNNLGDYSEYFRFKLNTNIPLEKSRPLYDDSGGTNMGPPTPPPTLLTPGSPSAAD